MNILLSICIPTRNRAAMLEQSLEAITERPSFMASEEIEIIVCDNASTDDTPQVVAKFADRFDGRIHYVRHSEATAGRAFELAIRQGRGRFIKLADDSMEFTEGGLAHLLGLLRVCEPSKPAIVFLNGLRPAAEPVAILGSLDELLSKVSHQITWGGSFGIWRDHLRQIPENQDGADQPLAHLEALYQTASLASQIVVSNIRFADSIEPSRQGGYSLGTTFGNKYLSILRKFCEKIRPETLSAEKRLVLVEHILPAYFNPENDFARFPLEEHLDPFYGEEPYYQDALKSARHQYEISLQSGHSISTPQAWRDRNPHNETQMVRFFNIERVSVGKFTYGHLNVHYWGHPAERLTIGHYVSISEGVTFILGGNHPYKGFSTYPFKVKLLGSAREAQSKGPITVNDDVWIGTNALLLSGITVGQGAIIGAGSVVTHDVPPYAIVAGSPARVVRFRFKPEIIEKLMRIDFSTLDRENLTENSNILYREITDENIDETFELLSGSPLMSHPGSE